MQLLVGLASTSLIGSKCTTLSGPLFAVCVALCSGGSTDKDSNVTVSRKEIAFLMKLNRCDFILVCGLNVHKRCERMVPCNCGIKQKDLAEVLKEMSITPDKLKPKSSVSKSNLSIDAYFHLPPSPPPPSLPKQSSRRSVGSTSSHENGLLEHSPSIPAPIRTGTIPVELPASLAKKMTLNDFKFIKVKTIPLKL